MAAAGSVAGHVAMAIAATPTSPVSSSAVFQRVLPPLASLKAVLFDVDGTLTDSDPLHFLAFKEMLQEAGFQGGKPIDEAFFKARISGRHNPDIGRDLFPDWSEQRRDELLVEKEARFRSLALATTTSLSGLSRLCQWVAAAGLRRAAVTNAPRANAEQLIAALGLTEFFEELVIGSECERAKPFPDPYLEAMRRMGVEAGQCFAFEDSPSGLRSAVAAGLPTVGLLTSQSEEVLSKAGACLVIRDFDDARLWRQLEQ